MQDRNAVAALCRLRCVGISIRHTQISIAEVVTRAVTNIHGDGVTEIIQNIEMQHRNTVATRQCLRRVGIGTRNTQVSISEVVTRAVTNVNANSVAEIV